MRNSNMLSAIALLAAVLTIGSASAATINLGGNAGLLNLGGNGGSNATVDTDLGGGDGTNADVNIGGTGGLLDLFGNSEPTTGTIDLGDTGDARVNLFGGDGDSDATVTLGNGTNGILDDLFGGVTGGNDGSTTADVNLGVGDLVGGDGGGVLGPVTPTPEGNGSSNPGDLFGPGSGNGGGLEVAALEEGAACFDPNATQTDKLINRHAYTTAAMSSWRGATELKIVKIDLCASAKSEIGASANIAALQSYLAANPTFTARLGAKGYSPDDVIAVDRNGKTLIVYVS